MHTRVDTVNRFMLFYIYCCPYVHELIKKNTYFGAKEGSSVNEAGFYFIISAGIGFIRNFGKLDS